MTAFQTLLRPIFSAFLPALAASLTLAGAALAQSVARNVVKLTEQVRAELVGPRAARRRAGPGGMGGPAVDAQARMAYLLEEFRRLRPADTA